MHVVVRIDSPSELPSYVESDSVVMRETSFNGVQTLEADELRARVDDPSSQQTPTYTSRRSTYFRAPDAQSILFDGRISGDIQRDQPGALFIVETYSPHYKLRYDLNPGDSYTQTYELEDDQTRSGLGIGGTFVYEATTTIRYVGRENVTVPAGTFAACKFERLETYESDTGSRPTDDRTIWLGVSNGLVIREHHEIPTSGGQTANYVTELVEAAIDGEPVSGTLAD
jgi:hypothetical protein